MLDNLWPHWIPEHYAESDLFILRDQWRPRGIKIVWTGVPAHLDAALAAGPETIIVRDHALSEQKEMPDAGAARALGIAHARAIKEIADKTKAKYPNADLRRFVFEGINEPELWGKNPPDLVTQYEIARVQTMHADGLRAGVGNFNVGWPGDYGLADSAVNWDPFEPLFAVMDKRRDGDLLFLHEYWWNGGPGAMRPDANGNPTGGWLWDAGRYLMCPFTGYIVISEAGLDNAVATGTHSGWQHLDGDWDTKARRYVADLVWYSKRISQDPRILGACIFTHDHQDRFWEPFNTRNDVFLHHFLPALAAEPDPVPWGNLLVSRWRWLCYKYGDAYGLDPRLLAAVILQESGGKPYTISGAFDTGLMQVVAKEEGGVFANRPPVALLKNPDYNVRTGAGILRDYIRTFDGSVAYGLVAYNRGTKGVRDLDADEPGLRHPLLQNTLRAYANSWKALWGEPYPGDVGSYLEGYAHPPEPEPAKAPLNDPTWFTEEATREVEAAADKILASVNNMQRARALQKEATRQLYVVRGLPPP